jgi:hypothetical protein
MRYIIPSISFFSAKLSQGIAGARCIASHGSKLSLPANSLSATRDICKVIAGHLRGGDVVQLIGKVGAGKTAVTREIIREILQNDNEVVQSPTFSLALSYACTFFPPPFDISMS